MELRWLNERTAEIPEKPNVTVSFADYEDDTLIDIILGMLLQAFSK